MVGWLVYVGDKVAKRQTDRETETEREYGMGMIYSFRPLPLLKWCRWMTYHLTVHAIIMYNEEENQQTNDSVLD